MTDISSDDYQEFEELKDSLSDEILDLIGPIVNRETNGAAIVAALCQIAAEITMCGNLSDSQIDRLVDSGIINNMACEAANAMVDEMESIVANDQASMN